MDQLSPHPKSKRYKWNQPRYAPSEEWITKEYPKVDGKGRYKLVPVHAPGTRQGETGKPWRGILPPPGKHWQYKPDKLEELDQRGEIHWSINNNPRRKLYLTADKTLPYTDYWEGFRDAHHQSIMITGYPTEKNFQMLELIVGGSSEEGDLVLDPFCGSGTTLHAANNLGRKWIGIDQSFVAIETAVNRMRHGLKRMGDYVERKAQNKKSGISDLFHDVLKDASQERARASNPGGFSFVTDARLWDQYKEEITDISKL